MCIRDSARQERERPDQHGKGIDEYGRRQRQGMPDFSKQPPEAKALGKPRENADDQPHAHGRERKAAAKMQNDFAEPDEQLRPLLRARHGPAIHRRNPCCPLRQHQDQTCLLYTSRCV